MLSSTILRCSWPFSWATPPRFWKDFIDSKSAIWASKMGVLMHTYTKSRCQATMDPKFDEHPELATSFVLRTGCDFDPAHHPRFAVASDWAALGGSPDAAAYFNAVDMKGRATNGRDFFRVREEKDTFLWTWEYLEFRPWFHSEFLRAVWILVLVITIPGVLWRTFGPVLSRMIFVKGVFTCYDTIVVL